MAITGKPSVIEARAALSGDTSAALRPIQAVIAAIRERLRLIEAELNALIIRVADLGTDDPGGDVADLQSQIDALVLRVAALESITLTDWYVNGALVGTRRRVNFIQAGGITISGADDGDRANITFGALVDILIPLSLSRTGLVLTGRELTLQLGRFIDVTRRSLVLTGRTVGMSLSADTLLTVNHGSLHLAGRTLGLELTQDIELPVTRGALRLAGRNVGLGTGLSVVRGHLGLAGHDVALAASAAVDLVVDRGHLQLSGRDVTIVAPTFTFFRDYTDLSTTNLTSYQGTIDASSGALIATPTGTHQRVYFDLLPDPITGAFDLTTHFNNTLGGFRGVLIYSQGDTGATATYQNGYWVDNFGGSRFIKFVSGVATGLGSGATSNGTLRVVRDASGNWEIFVGGVSQFTVLSETTYTSGRFGLIFGFVSPQPNIDYGINYTP